MSRFCKDCKHAKDAPDGNPYRMTCDAPQNSVQTVDDAKYLVSGIKQPTVIAIRGMTCSALRLNRGPAVNETVCGPDGNWFEVKK